MHVNDKGVVTKSEIVEGIIRSAHKMTYDEIMLILDGDEKACKQLGQQPIVMLVYIKFRKGQKIQLLQYAHLKARILMCYGVKHLSVNIAYCEDSNQEINNDGSIQIWIA